MSESPQTPVINLTTPEDVLDVLPTMLGFYPTESLCAIVLNTTGTDSPTGAPSKNATGTRRRVVLTIRADLPTSRVEAVEAAAYLEGAVQAHGTSALVVAYSADQHQARAVMTWLVGAVEPGTLESVILAVPQGWSTIDLEQPSYVSWTNPYTKRTSTAAAQAAAAGLYASGTRDDITDSVAAPGPASVEAFHTAWADLHPTGQHPTDQHPTDRPGPVERAVMVTDATAYLTEHVAGPFTITTPDVAWLVALVQLIEVRDAALLLVSRANAAQHVAVWRQVAALTPDVEAGLPALCLLGMSAWIAGQGALANTAAARADRLPGAGAYTLLRLLRHALDHAVSPDLWDQMRDNLT